MVFIWRKVRALPPFLCAFEHCLASTLRQRSCEPSVPWSCPIYLVVLEHYFSVAYRTPCSFPSAGLSLSFEDNPLKQKHHKIFLTSIPLQNGDIFEIVFCSGSAFALNFWLHLCNALLQPALKQRAGAEPESIAAEGKRKSESKCLLSDLVSEFSWLHAILL